LSAEMRRSAPTRQKPMATSAGVVYENHRAIL